MGSNNNFYSLAVVPKEHSNIRHQMGVYPSLHIQVKQFSIVRSLVCNSAVIFKRKTLNYTGVVMSANMFSRLDPFDCKEGDFDYYLEQFENFLELNSVEDESKKVPLFISSIGQDAYKILKEICAPSDPKEKSFDQMKTLLVEYFARREFYGRNQRPGENTGVFVNEMKRLSMKCNFGPFAHDALRDRIACGKLPENAQKKKPSATPFAPKETHAQQQEPSVPKEAQLVAEKKAKGPKQQKSVGGAQQKKGHIALTSREKANKASQQQQEQLMEVHVHVQQNTAVAGAGHNVVNPDDTQKRQKGPKKQQGGGYGGGGTQPRRAALTSRRKADKPEEEEQSSCAVIM